MTRPAAAHRHPAALAKTDPSLLVVNSDDMAMSSALAQRWRLADGRT
ncbi:hypothetical protein [Mycolicibacterium agri]|nr:hypothetical protein [Mycolicibacterium agri]